MCDLRTSEPQLHSIEVSAEAALCANLKPGMKVQAEADGVYYAAEVVEVSHKHSIG